MSFPDPAATGAAKAAARGLRGRVSSLLWGALSLGLLAGVYSCGAVDHSGEPGLITVTVDSSATGFSRLTVALQDSAGKQDTLFNDSLRDPSQLRHMATRNYRGEKAVIIISGFRNGVQVYQEKRVFDSVAPSATRRDTVQDLSAALTSLRWNARETFMSMGDTSHVLSLSVLPVKGDDRAEYTLSDSNVITLKSAGKDALGAKFRVIPRKAGQTWIKAVSKAHPEFLDSTSVRITSVVVVIAAPKNRTLEWSTSSKPTWYWSKGSLKGNGFFRVRIDNDSIAGGETVGDTSYTSPTPLADGPHILYAQELDADLNYSGVTPMPLRVDTDPPLAPKAENIGLAVTGNPRPTWKWIPQGKGIGIYRVKVDDSDLGAGAVSVDSLRFTSRDSLGAGLHTFRVQERDSAGNWSLSGQATVRVVPADTTPPKAPLRKPGTGGEGGLYETVHWGSGGPDGSGIYRYLLDKTDFEKDRPIETLDSSLTLDPDMDTTLVRHTLLVQERDSVGNWSGSTTFVFNSGRFSFIRFINGSDFVLTLDPEANTVRLRHKILDPKSDSERAVQRLQLWKVRVNFSPKGGSTLWNPFRNKVLRHQGGIQGETQGVSMVDDDDAGFTQDSARIWNVEPTVFTGGAPPEPYRWISPYGLNLRLLVDGSPAGEASPVIIGPESLPDAGQIWVLDRHKVWYLE
jgi:hypothetical protein